MSSVVAGAVLLGDRMSVLEYFGCMLMLAVVIFAQLPEDLPKSYVDQFGVSYRHILQIDRHRPWTVPEAASIVERLAPEYLPHELAAGNRAARREAVLRQRAILNQGEGAGIWKTKRV